MNRIQQHALNHSVHHQRRRCKPFLKGYYNSAGDARLFVEAGPEGLVWHAEVSTACGPGRDLNQLRAKAESLLGGVGVRDSSGGSLGTLWFHMRRRLTTDEALVVKGMHHPKRA